MRVVARTKLNSPICGVMSDETSTLLAGSPPACNSTKLKMVLEHNTGTASPTHVTSDGQSARIPAPAPAKTGVGITAIS